MKSKKVIRVQDAVCNDAKNNNSENRKNESCRNG